MLGLGFILVIQFNKQINFLILAIVKFRSKSDDDSGDSGSGSESESGEEN